MVIAPLMLLRTTHRCQARTNIIVGIRPRRRIQISHHVHIIIPACLLLVRMIPFREPGVRMQLLLIGGGTREYLLLLYQVRFNGPNKRHKLSKGYLGLPRLEIHWIEGRLLALRHGIVLQRRIHCVRIRILQVISGVLEIVRGSCARL